MNGSQYIIRPPDIPAFIYKTNVSAFKQLISWATTEHRKRLGYCARRGYYREWKRLHEDYSPMRVLAEMEGFHKICSLITEELWNELSMRERSFIRKAYELRGLLMKRRYND